MCGVPPLLWRGAARVQGLAIHFGEPFGGAEHGHRLDRLVGRDHHHGVGAGFESRVGDVDRSENIGLDPLVPIALQDRNVFQSCGVKHQVRLEFGDQFEDPLAVADVGDPPFDNGRPCARGKAFEHAMQRRFGILDDQ